MCSVVFSGCARGGARGYVKYVKDVKRNPTAESMPQTPKSVAVLSSLHS